MRYNGDIEHFAVFERKPHYHAVHHGYTIVRDANDTRLAHETYLGEFLSFGAFCNRSHGMYFDN